MSSYTSGAPVLISYPTISSSDKPSKYLINARMEFPWAETSTVYHLIGVVKYDQSRTEQLVLMYLSNFHNKASYDDQYVDNDDF